jgi:hypothetical protein
MKILILIIYSDNDEKNAEVYRKMANIHMRYVNNFENVSSYFIQMREKQTNNIEIEDKFIYVKGNETLMNIMHKTIEAMDYLFNTLGFDYNYVIRTNISTVLNIPQLKSYCKNLPKKNIYTGSSILKLNWIDYNSGIKDNSLFGTEYAQGVCIVMSKDVVYNILDNKKNIKFDIIDDLSFGIYIKNFMPKALENMHKYKIEKCEDVVNICVPEISINKDIVVFRNRFNITSNNKIYDRYADIYNMQQIYKIIY